jgi:hypothetical protein
MSARKPVKVEASSVEPLVGLKPGARKGAHGCKVIRKGIYKIPARPWRKELVLKLPTVGGNPAIQVDAGSFIDALREAADGIVVILDGISAKSKKSGKLSHQAKRDISERARTINALRERLETVGRQVKI